MDIAQMLVATKNRLGYPEKFRTCWGKNTDEKIFQVASVLHDNDLDKGMSLGRQSNNKEVLVNIKRDNIRLEAFSSLQRQFNDRNVPIYAEMILGLPGETLESWIDGIEELLRAGLNNQIYVYEAEVLPNTEMGDPAYQQKYGIKTKQIELTEIHCTPRSSDWIKEYQEIIVETTSFTISDWRRMLVISSLTMLLHSMKLGFYLMWYLHKRHGCNFTDLIVAIVEKAADGTRGIITKEINELFSYANRLLAGHGRGQLLPKFGEVFWHVEEVSFLRISEQLDSFYKELKEIVTEMLSEADVPFDDDELHEVFVYQSCRIMRSEGEGRLEFRFQRNIPELLEYMFRGQPPELKKVDQTLVLEQNEYYGDSKLYATDVVLRGRKSGKICRPVDYAACNWIAEGSVTGKRLEKTTRKFDTIHSFENYKSL
jgi:putative methyltransferase